MFGKKKSLDEVTPVDMETTRLLENSKVGYHGAQATDAITRINAAITESALTEHATAFVNGISTVSYAGLCLSNINIDTLQVVAYEYKRRGYTVIFYVSDDGLFHVFVTWDRRIRVLECLPTRVEPETAKEVADDVTAQSGEPAETDKQSSGVEQAVCDAGDFQEDDREGILAKLFDCSTSFSIYGSGKFVTVAPTFVVSLLELGISISSAKGWTANKLCQYLVGYAALVDCAKHNLCPHEVIPSCCWVPIGNLPSASLTAARKRLQAVEGVVLEECSEPYLKFEHNNRLQELWKIAAPSCTYDEFLSLASSSAPTPLHQK